MLMVGVIRIWSDVGIKRPENWKLRRQLPSLLERCLFYWYSTGLYTGTNQIRINRADARLLAKLLEGQDNGTTTATIKKDGIRLVAGNVDFVTSRPDQMLHLSNSSGPVLKFENTDTIL